MTSLPQDQMIDPFSDFPSADDNVVQTFHLEATNIRGRIVRLGGVLDDILGPHAYPEPVAHLTAEAVVLALLLSSMLKFDGRFTIQTQSDGPVSLLVADVTTPGDVRACATFDAERIEHAQASETENIVAQYLGSGILAFTVDQGDQVDRYQGLVDLKGRSLSECVQHYFKQSEQILTDLKVSVQHTEEGWRAGGLLLQNMPGEGGVTNDLLQDEDAWPRSMILMRSCTDAELLDKNLHSNVLLARLFHEEEVRVFAPSAVQKICRCNAQRIENIIQGMSDEDLEYAAVEGAVALKCEFCSREFVYEYAALMHERLAANASKTKAASE
jgi:molecular chaperone Hsp33